MKNFFYHLSLLESRITAHVSQEKYLHPERFSYPHEFAHLSFAQPHDYGLFLGMDQFDRIIQITGTPKRQSLGNVLYIVPSQGGKSTGFKRQLEHWKGSAIVNDIKGELSRDTAHIRRGFSDVYFIDLTGNGDHFNPVQGKTDEHELYAMANLLLHQRREDGNGIAFTEQATEMLTLLFQVATRAGFPPFLFVSQIVRLGLNRAAKQIHEMAPDLARQLLDGDYQPDKNYTDNKYLANSWELLKSRMYPLLTEAVVKTLTGSSFKIADLLSGKRPVTIYLTWPERYLSALKPLMKLFWGTFVDELKTIYNDLTRYSPRADLHRILFLIDEGGVTHVPELHDHVSTVNGYGMSFVMGIQSISQLDAYGKSNAETILNNCSKVFSWQDSLETADYLSRMLGGKSGFSSSHTAYGSEGKQEQKIPLLSPQEIMGMSEAKRLIFHRGLRYAIQAKRLSFTPPKRLRLPARSETPVLPGFPVKSSHTFISRHSFKPIELFSSASA